MDGKVEKWREKEKDRGKGYERWSRKVRDGENGRDGDGGKRVRDGGNREEMEEKGER